MTLCRAQYSTADDFKEYVDIYRIWESTHGRGDKHVGKKIWVATVHVDDLDNRVVTDILDVGGTPEFEFGATDVVEVGFDE